MVELHLDGTAVVSLAGEIDIAVVASINEQVDGALAASPTGLTIDMAGVSFIDSTGIGAIVRAWKACTAASIPLAIAAPSPAVRRMLQLTGLEAVLEVQAPAADVPAVST